MYISGSFNNFGARLHQLPTGIADLLLFQIEGSQYTGLSYISKNTKNHWSDEYFKQATIVYHLQTGTNIFP